MTDHDIWRRAYQSAAQAAATRAKWWRRAWRVLAVCSVAVTYLTTPLPEPVRSLAFIVFIGKAALSLLLGREHWDYCMRQRQQHLDTLHELERTWREQA